MTFEIGLDGHVSHQDQAGGSCENDNGPAESIKSLEFRGHKSNCKSAYTTYILFT